MIVQASNKEFEEVPPHAQEKPTLSPEEKKKQETIARKRLPHAVWFEKLRDKGGRTKLKPHKGIIIEYNAFYHKIIMEIDEVPSLVPWDEVLFPAMRYRTYWYGGQF